MTDRGDPDNCATTLVSPCSAALDSNSSLITITINAVNDAPVNSAPATATTAEDTTLAFTGASTISVSDVDAGGGDVEVTLTATNGTISLATTAA